MTRLLALACLALVAACGVDGPPIPPSQVPAEAQTTGISVTGTAEIGIVGGNG
ncbi:hypothetical protein [Tabrizicola sp. TH137]|uniref:hypothetical protein n=1 Tax=Tabrizicola sp. TH137 TaxID=2067452 RepID=UPI0015710E49|nr:hypothetical protein [Tabrizicola sp. TH137]